MIFDFRLGKRRAAFGWTQGKGTAPESFPRNLHELTRKREAVETVEGPVRSLSTLVKQGVNERGKRFLNFEFRFWIGRCSRSVAAGMRLQLGFTEAPVFVCSMIIFFMRTL